MTLDRSWFESLFDRENNDRRILKCVDMTVENAANKGENYASEVQRVTLQVELGSGERSSVAYVVKYNRKEIDLSLGMNLFESEIAAYGILKDMERLMKFNGDHRDTLWCQMKGHTDDAIVFDDLAVNGYKCIKKVVMADKEESIWALSELARFHAMGLAVINQRPEILSYKCYMYEKKPQEMLHYSTLGYFRDAVKEKWGPEWSDAVNYLNEMLNNLGKVINTMAVLSEESLKVIVHGDFWSGNIMYKRDFRGKVLGLKFVDFQMTSANSFAFDLCHFLNCAVKRELRSPELTDELLRVYQKSLIENMEFYQMDTAKAPSFEQVKDFMERLRGYSFIIECLSWPFFAEELDIDLTKMNEKGGIFNPSMYESERTKNILGGKLRALISKGKPWDDMN